MKPPSEPPPSDRRANERHFACFPASVQRLDGETRTALIRDLSVTGALLLVRRALEIGEKVKLQLHINEDEIDESRPATGEVVRVVPLSEGEMGIWRRKVAVKFDDELTIYAEEIEALRQRQERLGVK